MFSVGTAPANVLAVMFTIPTTAVLFKVTGAYTALPISKTLDDAPAGKVHSKLPLINFKVLAPTIAKAPEDIDNVLAPVIIFPLLNVSVLFTKTAPPKLASVPPV